MKTPFGIILANLTVTATIMTFSACATHSATNKTEGTATTGKPAPAATVETVKPGVTAVPATAPANKVTLAVVKVDSEETAGEDGKGANAVDGNPDTFWHTQWQDDSPSHPHEIIVELTPPSTIKGFTYLPRQDDTENGTIANYEFYVSNDGKDFGQPVKKGTFENSKDKKTVTFEPVKCHFIKLKALSEVNDGVWTSAAEIGVVLGD
jgi:hexosaminidase